MTFQAAVFGLGSMGFGMAKSCVEAGLSTYGFDLDSASVSRFEAAGGMSGAVADVAPTLDAAVVVVLNAVQVEDVLFGSHGVVTGLPKGAVVMACATVPPDFARDMEKRCAEHGIHYLDAPISGGSVKAGRGQLGVMASGSPDAFAAAKPVLDATAERVFHLGDAAGSGSAMKAVNQLLAGVHIATMAEALTFGMTQGIDPHTFVNVITKCAGNSWMLENRAPHVVDGDYTPHSQVNIWPKDLGIVLQAAEATGFDATIAKAAHARYMQAVDMGLGREDDAAITKVYAHEAGLALPKSKS
ncbi:MAG: L-threonate dehydrogenase [Pseudomonadota bacterium]